MQQATADLWIAQGIAESHDPQSYILDKIQDKEASITIIEINQKLEEFNDDLALKQAELKEEYDKKYSDALAQSKSDEKKAIKDQRERPDMTKEELSTKIIQIRKKYDSTQDNILQEKISELKTLDDLYKEKIKKFADSYEFDPYVKIVWNSNLSKYEAVKRN